MLDLAFLSCLLLTPAVLVVSFSSSACLQLASHRAEMAKRLACIYRDNNSLLYALPSF